jgi:hypothetical protein
MIRTSLERSARRLSDARVKMDSPAIATLYDGPFMTTRFKSSAQLKHAARVKSATSSHVRKTQNPIKDGTRPPYFLRFITTYSPKSDFPHPRTTASFTSPLGNVNPIQFLSPTIDFLSGDPLIPVRTLE